MKIKNIIASIIVGCVGIVGCTTSVPNVTTSPNGSLTTNQTAVVNSNQIASTLATLTALNSTSAPVNPYAPIVTIAIGLVGAIAAGISTIIAAQKNGQLKTANGVNSTIISAVENLPPAISQPVKQSVSSRAANLGTSAAVNAAVQANT